MAEEIRAHKTSVSFVEAVPAELDAGSDLTLKVKVACVSHCDLRGRPVRIIDDSGAVITAIELLRFDGTVNETDISIVRAPAKPGTCKWTAAFTAREEEEIPHEASSPPFSFSVKPHGTRVAVWDVPSPVVFGTAFRVKIGVQCSAGCDLTGQKIAIYDDEGVRVAAATLGAVPWSTASDQFCAEVELKAPVIESRYMWEVKFPEPDMELAHERSASLFALGVAGQPEHVATVQVVALDTRTPVKGASVTLRPTLYRGSYYSSLTDDAGVARVRVPKGEYHVCATNGGYRGFTAIAEVTSDIAVTAELVAGSDLDDIWGATVVI